MVRPRYASTVVLARPADQGNFEILLTRRPQEMRFLGGFYVFPGGTVHDSDYSQQILDRCSGITGEQARAILGNHHDFSVALGHWVAVFRELFEEVGVLLCHTETGDQVDLRDERTRERIEQKRRAMVKKEIGFAAVLESENLFCDLSRAAYFDHWVTPDRYSMRFDTRFYIAEMPPYQTPLAISEEVTHSLWVNPAEAMIRMGRRDFPILPPTTIVLGELARVASWDRLCGQFHLR